MKKKVLAMFLTLCMCTSIMIGCSNQNEQNTDDAKSQEEVSDESGESDAADEMDGELEECTIKFTSWMTKGEDDILLEGFMKENQQVTVEGQFLDGSNYLTILMPMFLNGDIPDVFIVSPDQLKDLAKEGYIQPVSDIPGVSEQAETMSTMVSSIQYDGEFYGYALSVSLGNQYVYYNKVYFEENNLEIPTTLDEFEALCAQIKELGDDPLLLSAGDVWSTGYYGNSQLFYKLNELGEFDTHGAEIALLKGEMKPSDLYGESFRQLEKYYNNGWISEGGLSMGWEAATQYLIDGGAQMLASGNWVPSSEPILNNTNEEFELGAFPLPGIPDENGIMYTSSSVGTILVMGANTENREAAQAFFEYVMREDVLAEYITSLGSYTLNAEVEVNPVLEYAFDIYTDQSLYALGDTSMSGMPSNWKANYNQYLADVCAGSDVDELLEKLDADYESIISTINVQEYLDALE